MHGLVRRQKTSAMYPLFVATAVVLAAVTHHPVVSAGGNSQALIGAIETAIDKNMTVLLLSAATDDLLSATVGYNDVLITTAEFSGQLTTQAQFQIVQCICVLVDHQIFGGE